MTSLAWEPAHAALPARRLASASKDATIRIWDAPTGRLLFAMGSHTAAVTAVKWGGDGLIYSAARDCTINVWAAEDGRMVRSLKVRVCVVWVVGGGWAPERASACGFVFIIYYLLFIIYYLLFIIYYLLFIIYYLLFIIYALLFIIIILLFPTQPPP